MSHFSVRMRLVAAAALIVLVTSPAGAQPGNNKPREWIRVSFVNVGAGLCTVIECPGNEQVILYDCGGNGQGNQAIAFAQQVLGQYQNQNQNGRIAVVVSHTDLDHYRFIGQIMANFQATSVWLGGELNQYNNWLWLNGQVQNRTPIITFEKGAFGTMSPQFLQDFNNVNQPVTKILGPACGSARVELLTVNASGDAAQQNANSLILRVEYNDFSVTLTGDANVISLAGLLANYHAKDLQTTVMSAPHHGAVTDGSNSGGWVSIFKPRIVVYSAGNQYGHPRCEAVENYRLGGSLVEAQGHPMECGQQPVPFNSQHAEYLTRVNGNIWITSDGTRSQVDCDAQGVNCNLVQ